MSKLIIHNETNLPDNEALEYLYKTIKELIEMPDMSYCEFTDNIRVQIYYQKTCKTFYIYGRK